MYSWLMLALAVVAEVISTVSMKYASTHSPLIGYLTMATFIALSFYAFSRALLKIPLAVTYAIWEGAGLLLIIIAGFYIFGEDLNGKQLIAIVIMSIGLLLVTFDKETSQ